jgi:hypothetical protein
MASVGGIRPGEPPPTITEAHREKSMALLLRLPRRYWSATEQPCRRYEAGLRIGAVASIRVRGPVGPAAPSALSPSFLRGVGGGGRRHDLGVVERPSFP